MILISYGHKAFKGGAREWNVLRKRESEKEKGKKMVQVKMGFLGN